MNQSSRPIVRAQVKVCDQTLTFKELTPGKSESAYFIVSCESHFSVLVDIQEQPPLVQELGYVTSGFDYIDYLVITDKKVLLNPAGYEGKIIEARFIAKSGAFGIR